MGLTPPATPPPLIQGRNNPSGVALLLRKGRNNPLALLFLLRQGRNNPSGVAISSKTGEK
jgi:hypothetical protein